MKSRSVLAEALETVRKEYLSYCEEKNRAKKLSTFLTAFSCFFEVGYHTFTYLWYTILDLLNYMQRYNHWKATVSIYLLALICSCEARQHHLDLFNVWYTGQALYKVYTLQHITNSRFRSYLPHTVVPKPINSPDLSVVCYTGQALPNWDTRKLITNIFSIILAPECYSEA